MKFVGQNLLTQLKVFNSNFCWSFHLRFKHLKIFSLNLTIPNFHRLDLNDLISELPTIPFKTLPKLEPNQCHSRHSYLLHFNTLRQHCLPHTYFHKNWMMSQHEHLATRWNEIAETYARRSINHRVNLNQLLKHLKRFFFDFSFLFLSLPFPKFEIELWDYWMSFRSWFMRLDTRRCVWHGNLEVLGLFDNLKCLE